MDICYVCSGLEKKSIADGQIRPVNIIKNKVLLPRVINRHDKHLTYKH